MKKLFILIALLFSLSIQNAFAQQSDSSKSQQVTAHNVIYVEGATMIIMGSVSLNYEHSFNEYFWLRLGYGIGIVGEMGDTRGLPATGEGPMLMAVFLTGDKNKFEFGLGVSFITKTPYYNYYRDKEDEFLRLPAVAIGYRYQPVEGGLLFRTGLTFDYYGGFPLEISLGYAF